MARYPGADWRPMPENDTEPAIVPTQVILHSAVSGRDNLDEYFCHPGVDVESHFYVRWDGSVQQYVDTSKQADANYRANARAVSIETEDDGDPDRKPWSPEQMASLTALVAWLCDTHAIPKRPCRGPLDPGIGYHSQFRDWSPVAKTCPGLARRPQVPQIIAAVGGGAVAASRIPDISEEDPLAAFTEADLRKFISEEVSKVLTASGTAGAGDRGRLWEYLEPEIREAVVEETAKVSVTQGYAGAADVSKIVRALEPLLQPGVTVTTDQLVEALTLVLGSLDNQ